MTRVPFREAALVRRDEAQQASTRLLTSLDQLRDRADNFLTVAGSTAAIFAALANATPPQSGAAPSPVPAAEHEDDPVETAEPVTASEPGQTGYGANGSSLIGDAAVGELGVASLLGEAFEARPVAQVGPGAITSGNRVTGTVGRPVWFTVTTTGDSVPSITHRGDLPKGLRVFDNGDGTATISGKPKAAGVHRLRIRAKFGQGADKYVVAQTFTVDVEERD